MMTMRSLWNWLALAGIFMRELLLSVHQVALTVLHPGRAARSGIVAIPLTVRSDAGIAMLANMSDPKSIGPAMAVALLTTLYGAIEANMIAIPIADKLELRSGEEQLSRCLVLDAIMGIQDGQNPRVIQSMLQNYLNQSKRNNGSE